MINQQVQAVTIAGHDSDGSAGMPADLHAFFVDGVYGHGLLTAAVSGNSYGIDAAQVMPKDYIEQQFKTLSTDFKISAAKTGMLANDDVINVVADQYAKEVDFFSIGRNALIEYTMAAYRMNEQVSYLYQPYNPSILRLINNVIKAAHAEGKWAGMCGEMAGDQTAVPLLVGMGLDEFSMSATSVLRTRSLMKKLDTAKMEEYANRALTECATMEEVLELSKEYVNVD